MQTGRASAASRMPTIPGERLSAPEDLDEFEKTEWESIVAGLPPGWIQREHVPIMRQLCRHAKIADHLGVVINRLLADSMNWKADDERWGQVRAMTKAQAVETAAIIQCSKVLRLTKLADRPERASVKVRRSSAVPVKPWADWGTREPGKPISTPS